MQSRTTNIETLTKQAALYKNSGCVFLPALIAPEMASNFTLEIQKIVGQVGDKLLAAPRVGDKPAYELYGYRYWPMVFLSLCVYTPNGDARREASCSDLFLLSLLPGRRHL